MLKLLFPQKSTNIRSWFTWPGDLTFTITDEELMADLLFGRGE
jgi:hypothetical protein